MPDMSLPTAVNPHVLRRLVALAQRQSVLVMEDIFDQRGQKLAAAGDGFTPEVQARITQHKLKRPLEACLGLESAPDAQLIVERARHLIDTCAPLRRILALAVRERSPIHLLATVEFSHSTALLLGLAADGHPQALDHCVLVSLLAIAMARTLRLSEDDQVAAGIAGLLHDLGELYIDPAWLAPGKRLRPHEWAHIVAHPRIGQMLVNELDSFPLAVGRAVAEHHERFNGSGYPRQVGGHSISGPGQAVAVAEMIAGLLNRDQPLERAELALKIIPGEQAHDLVSAVSGALRTQARLEMLDEQIEGGADVERLFWRMQSAHQMAEWLVAGGGHGSAAGRTLIARTLERLEAVQRAFVSTGLDTWMRPGHGLHEGGAAVHFERIVASREIEWRLRDLARDVALQSSGGDQAAFGRLIDLLDGTADEPDDGLAPPCGLHAPAPAVATPA
ncbi:HD-GYP domain-containing protein [Zemynaea arenosa]|nr:HD domain-containing phosphohydrolase [Massilia arenosa]